MFDLTPILVELPPELNPGPATILVVDDEERMRAFLSRVLSAEGYGIAVAVDGPSALASIATSPPDVVLLDVDLPGISGFEVCRRVRQSAATRLLPIIIITALEAREQRVEGLEAGADDFLTKPVDTQELLARVRSLVRIKHYTDDLDSAGSIIMTLATMIEARDGYSVGHCSRMANYATSLGRVLSLTETEMQVLYRGGFLHDVGMLAIPDAVLRKAGPLDPAEFELMKSHTVVGDALCSNLRSLHPVRPMVRSHHERLDGSGYPDGLRGDQIPIVAQIIGIVDVYEAVTTPRAYQSPQPIEAAVAILRHHVERGWRRREFVEAFVSILQTSETEWA